MIRLLAICSCLFIAVPRGHAGAISDLFCDDSARLEKQLTHRHGAQRLGRGMRGPDALIEVWIDSQGDWTLVQSHANGTSCIVAMGEHWQELTRVIDPA